jgi:hypothetical protein
LDLKIGVLGQTELGIGTPNTYGADGVNLVLLGQGTIEVVHPRFEIIIDADDTLTGLKHERAG